MTSPLESLVLRNAINRWYYIPALIWLMVTLVSGIWLRLEWQYSIQQFLSVSDLIHAHSHAAMLGWIYIAFAGFTLKYCIRTSTAVKNAIPMAVLLHVSNVGMFVSFSLSGYAFWSILWSSVHLVATLWLAYLLVFYMKKSENKLFETFLLTAWLWLIIAGFSPIALAISGGMSSKLAQFWLGSYLYLSTNGWILFMTLAVLVQNLPLERICKLDWLGYWLMTICLPFSMISMFYTFELEYQLYYLGWIMNIAFSAGTIIVCVRLLSTLHSNPTIKTIFFTGLCLLVAKSLLQVITFHPNFLYLTNYHLLKVAFLHLFLFGSVTLLIISGIYDYALLSKSYQKMINTSLLTGVLSMIFFIFAMPGLPLLGYIFIYPWHLLMAISGLLTLFGVSLIYINAINSKSINPNHS